jgi:heptosyltransferase-2
VALLDAVARLTSTRSTDAPSVRNERPATGRRAAPGHAGRDGTKIGAAVVASFAYLPSMRTTPSGHTPQEKLLVVTTRYIGDTVLAIPFLRNLRAAWPDADIHLHAEGAARHVLAPCPYIDAFVVRQRGGATRGTPWRAVGAAIAEVADLRRAGYTRAYLLKSAPSTALLTALAAIPQRIGFARGVNRLLLSHAVAIRERRHQADLYLDLLRADGIATDDGRNENWTSPEAAARAAAVVATLPERRPLVFLAPCATNARRNWPADRWAETLHWLVTARSCEIVLAGSPPDASMHAAVRAGLEPAVARHVHDFSAALSLREAAALLARCDLCVGIDTGLPHLATSFGVPTVRLFGPSDPVRWGVWQGEGAIVRAVDPTAAEPMLGITVAAVRDAVEAVLDHGRRAPQARRVVDRQLRALTAAAG